MSEVKAVFYDTGGGDIYGGSTKEACLEAMKSDMGADFVERDVFEVNGDTKMLMQDEDERPTDELMTLNDAYTELGGAYCVATDNC